MVGIKQTVVSQDIRIVVKFALQISHPRRHSHFLIINKIEFINNLQDISACLTVSFNFLRFVDYCDKLAILIRFN